MVTPTSEPTARVVEPRNGVSVAVVGAGPGGLATAVDLAMRGHRVSVLGGSPARVDPWRARGGVEVVVDGEPAIVPVANLTSEPEEALAEASMVFVAVPAYAQAAVVRRMLPWLRDSVALLLMPGCCGSLEVADILTRAGRDVRAGILIGEAITVPRFGLPAADGTIHLRPPAPRTRVSAFPAVRTGELMERLASLINAVATPNVLDPGLNNPNFLFHPAPMLLNYASVERQNGRLGIMNEGMTAGVLRCLDAMDAEKGMLMRELGLQPIALDDLYREETGHSPDIYRMPGGPRAQADRVLPRYLDEDVSYGAVTFSSLGRQLGVPMPLTDATISLLSVATGRDLAADGRTAERLGLAGMTSAGVGDYLQTGSRGH